MMATIAEHVPVLATESLELLQVKQGGTYVDCTVGLGGHAQQVLSRLAGTGVLIGLDRDKQAVQAARERLEPRFENFRLYHENFKNLPLILGRLKIRQVDGCLADLGMSSCQLEAPTRGFSFQVEGPLDMRMDTEQKTTAAQLVNELPEERLAEIFQRYGEEKAARRMAAAIVKRRRVSPLRTTTELAELAAQVKGRAPGSRLHPATQVFQALRIEVNQELEGLEEFLTQSLGYLAPGGRLVMISFHSLEDRVVKTVFRREAGKCVCFRPLEVCTCPRIQKVRVLTPKPVAPSTREVGRNPRSRSAKLRAVEKLPDSKEWTL